MVIWEAGLQSLLSWVVNAHFCVCTFYLLAQSPYWQLNFPLWPPSSVVGTALAIGQIIVILQFSEVQISPTAHKLEYVKMSQSRGKTSSSPFYFSFPLYTQCPNCSKEYHM